MAKKTKNGKGKRRALAVLCSVLGVVLVVMLGATIGVSYLYGRMNIVDPSSPAETLSQEELDQLLQGETDPEVTGPELDPTDGIDTDHDTQIGGKESGIVNILLIGQDRREGETRARSDSMILCTYNPSKGTLTMTSFLRDLWVKIPGYGNNRINVAYAVGGMTLLNETLEENFGVYVDGNIEVDFNRFAEIVDLLGGVEMELRQDEANLINRECGSALTSGVQMLEGDEALTYARIRKLDADGDFSRTNRQRKVLNSLVTKFKDSSLSTMLNLLNEVLPMITTDMSQAQIVSLATSIFPSLSNLEVVSQRVPADGAYKLGMISGMSVIQADMDAARAMLEQTLK